MPATPLTWLNQQTINTTTAGSQFDADVTQLANGNFVVSWTTSDAGGLGSPAGNETFAQIFDVHGNKVGAEIRLNNASTTGDEQNADLAALPGGGFVVVYHDVDNPFNGDASNLRLEEYDANGAQVTETALIVNDAGLPADPDYFAPRVAVSSATSILIVYEERSAGDSGIYGKVYNSTTDTYGAQIPILTGGLSGGTRIPDIAVLSNGNYAIVADRGDADSSLTYRVLNSSGGSVLGASFVTGTNADTFNDRESTITALAGGGFVIAWTNTDTNDTDILFRVYDNAGVQQASGSAGDNGATNNNNESKVIGLADGTFVIAWDNDEVTGLNVQHFSATGGTLGTPFVVSTDNVDELSGVRLADGRLALVWNASGGEIQMEILDTRDNANATAVYTTPTFIGVLGNDTIYGTGAAETFFGYTGNDVVVSAGGADTATLGAGNDYIYAGDGTDTAAGDAGIDVLLGEAGADTLRGGDDQDYLFGGADADVLYGDGGVDVLQGGDGNDIMYGGAEGDYFYGENNDDTGYGEAGNDIFVMAAGNDTGVGGDGQDYFYMGDGNDVSYGGDGVDVVLGEAGDDAVNPGLGTDYVYLGTGSDSLFVDKNTNGVTVLYDFTAGDASSDAIILTGTGWTSFAQVQAAITDYTASGGFCILTLDSDTSIWLIGVAPNQLTAGDFAIA